MVFGYFNNTEMLKDNSTQLEDVINDIDNDIIENDQEYTIEKSIEEYINEDILTMPQDKVKVNRNNLNIKNEILFNSKCPIDIDKNIYYAINNRNEIIKPFFIKLNSNFNNIKEDQQFIAESFNIIESSFHIPMEIKPRAPSI